MSSLASTSVGIGEALTIVIDLYPYPQSRLYILEISWPTTIAAVGTIFVVSRVVKLFGGLKVSPELYIDDRGTDGLCNDIIEWIGCQFTAWSTHSCPAAGADWCPPT